MRKKTIVTVTGIRPDLVRMAEVFRKLDEAEWCEHIQVWTGQHYDWMMSGVFFEELHIKPAKYSLGIGQRNRSHVWQVADLGPKIVELLNCFKKVDLVVFLGDSNSVLAAVPLRKEGYRIAHIEAGMRSGDKRMLEETNRIVCDHCSDLLFVYHKDYKSNLLSEGIEEGAIFTVGNTIVEPCLRAKKLVCDFAASKRDSIIVDIHRPENFNYPKRLTFILDFAARVANTLGVPAKMLRFDRTMQALLAAKVPWFGKIDLTGLMSYNQFVKAQYDAVAIISDSGTAQEEAPLLQTPVLVPRDFSERPQSYSAGNSLKIFCDKSLREEVSRACSFVNSIKSRAMDVHWLGDGNTAKKIVDIMRD